MAMTIGPAVCPARRLRRLSQLTFFLGALAGSLVSYGVLRGLLVNELHIGPSAALWVIVAAAGLGSLRDLGTGVPVPYLHRQVPEWVRGLLPLPATSSLYGFLLGLGFATKFTFGAHLTLMAVLATTTPPWVAAVGLTLYALVRAVCTSVGRPDQSVGALAQALQHHGSQERYLRIASIALTTGLAATALASIAP